mgnify:CR=1 FL=1
MDRVYCSAGKGDNGDKGEKNFNKVSPFKAEGPKVFVPGASNFCLRQGKGGLLGLMVDHLVTSRIKTCPGHRKK